MPRQPRSPASASPTGPPPTTRTGTMSLPTCCDPMRCDHMQRPAEKVKHARRSIGSRPARCVPSPQRGEGQDEGVRDSQNNLQRPNPLPPTLSPLGRGSSLCQLLRTFMADASVLATRLGVRVFSECDRAREERGATWPASCVPSPQRGEGQVEGVRTSEINQKRPNHRTPKPPPPRGPGGSFHPHCAVRGGA